MRLNRLMGLGGWRGLGALLLAMASAFVQANAASVAASDDKVISMLHGQGLRHDGERVALWTMPGEFDAAEVRSLLISFDAGASAISSMLGRNLDTARYTEGKIHIFVSPAVTVSHVYGGYDHMDYDKPYVFLGLDKVRTHTAPWLHEMTHLLAWRFGSHSLREGFASFVELEISDRGIGNSSGVFGMTDKTSAERRAKELAASDAGRSIMSLIGSNGGADSKATSEMRAAYYVLSQSFVRHLVDGIGLAEFLQVYGSDDPSATLARISGQDLGAWRARWLAQLGH